MKNYSVLVTGSEGLIGKELSRKLEERKINVIGYDIKNGQDILDQVRLDKIISDVEGVIHLAAVSRVVAGYNDPYTAVVTNVIGTTNILDTIRRKNPTCWMIFGSSREVYGESGHTVKESDPQRPVNVYGASKSAGEYLSLCYGNNYNLRTFVVRFSNVYGGLNDHPDRVVPRFFNQALTNSDITVYGGNQVFDFVHLSDAVEGLIKLIQKIINNEKLEYRVFHFLTGKSISLIELSDKIIKLIDSKSSIKYLPKREFDVDTFVGDASATMSTLEWEPKISIDKGLKYYLKLIKG
ncbi:MAG TPA: NAD-dependent epimerase/dehydratase family protein [Candidatus Nitrosocosmicus sp.]|nr:NAD-dependent epimerase/dehydratase family protein [Candidatus Nitrosocosmicus sp.]